MAYARAPERDGVDPQWVTLIFVAVILGLVMAFSASYPEACGGSNDTSVDALSFFRSQFEFAIIGLAAGWLIGLVRPKWLRLAGLPVLLTCFGLMLAAIVQGSLTGGTRGSFAYLDLFGFVTFQPSELAKLFYVVYLSSLLAQGSLRDRSFLQLVQHPLTISCGLFCLLLLGQRDLGMMILIVVITLAMCYLGGMKARRLVPVILAILLLGAGYGLLDKGEHGGRLKAWVDPIATRSDNGYQILTMLVATARGGLFGEGLGGCPDKWGQMPEAHTDAIFCVMGGEMGFVRVALFVVLMGWIVLRAMQIGRATAHGFGSFLCSGIAIALGLQALINMAVATNLMPVTGLTLPYISYGGSSLVSCLMAAGMVLSVYRYSPEKQEEN